MAHESETYTVKLIKRDDGRPVGAAAQDYLVETGAIFDSELEGFVCAGPGLPMAYSVFLPMHGLTVSEVVVDYDPEWFSPPSPAPVFVYLPDPWDGRPLPSNTPGSRHELLWFLADGVNDGKPFMVNWHKGTWEGGGTQLLPSEIVASGWKLLATSDEVLGMSYARIDAANAAHLSRAARRAIAEDIEGSALQVAIKTGRLQRAALVDK